jgi:hypothetical protein
MHASSGVTSSSVAEYVLSSSKHMDICSHFAHEAIQTGHLRLIRNSLRISSTRESILTSGRLA